LLILATWNLRYNAYRFFVQNMIRVEKEEGLELRFGWTVTLEEGVKGEGQGLSDWNVMDRWILSATQSLIGWFSKEMAAYRLYTVVPVLVKFIDQLTNWYVRLNRRRLKVRSSTVEIVDKVLNERLLLAF
jgi:isoleucyl-tRNA synthetase